MTGGLFPRQLPGPRLEMQGSGRAVVASDFPGASEHLLPSPPQPQICWSGPSGHRSCKTCWGFFQLVGPAPPGLLAAWRRLDFLLLSHGVTKRPLHASFLRVLPSLQRREQNKVGLLPAPEYRLLQPGGLTRWAFRP